MLAWPAQQQGPSCCSLKSLTPWFLLRHPGSGRSQLVMLLLQHLQQQWLAQWQQGLWVAAVAASASRRSSSGGRTSCQTVLLGQHLPCCFWAVAAGAAAGLVVLQGLAAVRLGLLMQGVRLGQAASLVTLSAHFCTALAATATPATSAAAAAAATQAVLSALLQGTAWVHSAGGL